MRSAQHVTWLRSVEASPWPPIMGVAVINVCGRCLPSHPWTTYHLFTCHLMLFDWSHCVQMEPDRSITQYHAGLMNVKIMCKKSLPKIGMKVRQAHLNQKCSFFNNVQKNFDKASRVSFLNKMQYFSELSLCIWDGVKFHESRAMSSASENSWRGPALALC